MKKALMIVPEIDSDSLNVGYNQKGDISILDFGGVSYLDKDYLI